MQVDNNFANFVSKDCEAICLFHIYQTTLSVSPDARQLAAAAGQLQVSAADTPALLTVQGATRFS